MKFKSFKTVYLDIPKGTLEDIAEEVVGVKDLLGVPVEFVHEDVFLSVGLEDTPMVVCENYLRAKEKGFGVRLRSGY